MKIGENLFTLMFFAFCDGQKQQSVLFHETHRKTPVHESFFNKVARSITKDTLILVFSCEVFEFFKENILKKNSVQIPQINFQ